MVISALSVALISLSEDSVPGTGMEYGDLESAHWSQHIKPILEVRSILILRHPHVSNKTFSSSIFFTDLFSSGQETDYSDLLRSPRLAEHTPYSLRKPSF